MMLLDEDGFIPKWTESGHSYGSLEAYIDTWNAGDMAEVSFNPKLHPASPSALVQRMHEVGAAAEFLRRTVYAANETAKVLLIRQNIFLSPVPKIRVEYAIFIVNLHLFC